VDVTVDGSMQYSRRETVAGSGKESRDV